MNEFQADAIYEEERERRAGVTAWTELPTEPKHTCLNCGDKSGIGRGKEPTRYDIHWCSSKCWQEFYKNLQLTDVYKYATLYAMQKERAIMSKKLQRKLNACQLPVKDKGNLKGSWQRTKSLTTRQRKRLGRNNVQSN